jgi:O-antigen ligase
MPEHLKALVFILALVTPVFLFAGMQRVGLPIAQADYKRRAIVWYATTLLAFLSHDFWIFMIALAIMIRIAAAKEHNPLALTLVIALAVPPYFKDIAGGLGIDHLIAISPPRLLSLVLLLPLWFVLRQRKDVEKFGSLWPDRFLFAYLALHAVVQVISEQSLTNALRVGLVYPWLDLFLPYYVASRTVRSMKAFKDVAATLALISVVLAVLAIFEWIRYCLLYAALERALGVDWLFSNYLFRGEGGRLRAQASLGHSIVFGYTMVIGLVLFALLRPEMSAPRIVRTDSSNGRGSAGFGGRFGTSLASVFLAVPLALLSFIRPSSYVPGRPALAAKPTTFPSMAWRIGAAVIVGGMVVSLSRGPWVGGAAALLVLACTGPEVAARLTRLGIGLTMVVALLLTTEFGGRVVDLLPFVGTVDAYTVTYRQRLFDVSMDVVWQRPFFGAIDFMYNPMLETMRQGEGIIDIVNSYLQIALRNGLVGLALFAGTFIAAMVGLVQCLISIKDKDSEVHLLARVLLAALVGAMVTITTVASILTVPLLYYSLAGMAVGFRQMVLKGSTAAARQPVGAAAMAR